VSRCSAQPTLSLWERACPAMACEALLYPISDSVKDAANSGFAAALRQIAGQARLCLGEGIESEVRAVNGKLIARGAQSTCGSKSCHSPFHFGESPNSWMRAVISNHKRGPSQSALTP